MSDFDVKKELHTDDERLLATELDTDFIKNHRIFKKLTKLFNEKLIELENRGKTSKLWTRYFKMVNLLFDFISAERQGDWDLHLKTLELMIPFFHSAGHFLYSKAAEVYLQDMQGLEKKMCASDYNNFTKNGYWTCRRTAKFFAGIATDQTIEQTLMKQLHVGGGAFKTSCNESNVGKFVQAKLDSADMTEHLEEFCGVNFNSSDQHADTSDARIKRDAADVRLIINFFTENNPFPHDKDLISLSSGIVADENVNSHRAFEVGVETRNKYDGCNSLELSLSKLNNVKSILWMESKLKVFGSEIAIDPHAMFQRIGIMRSSDEDLSKYFHYELATYPVALFDKDGMRESEKSKLYELLEPIDFDCFLRKDNFIYIVDGGLLLHQLSINKKEKFSEICESFYKYTQRLFNKNVIIVFDGYSEDGTKSATRSRRSKKKNKHIHLK